jgi:DNA-binding GntR family transcriptional regulator
MQVIRTLWDSTEAYRGLYYAVGDERRAAIDAHDRILAALREGDIDDLVAELDAHRQRALDVLAGVLDEGSGRASR